MQIVSHSPITPFLDIPNDVRRMVYEVSKANDMISSALTCKTILGELDNDVSLRNSFIVQNDSFENITWDILRSVMTTKHYGHAMAFLADNKSKCHSCLVKVERLRTHKIDELKLCNQCMESPDFFTITQSTAIKEYHVSKTELDELDCATITNPRFRSSSPMILFKLKDVKSLSEKKYKNYGGLSAFIEQKEAKRS